MVLFIMVVVMLLFILSNFILWLYDVISVFFVVVKGIMKFFLVCLLWIVNGLVILIGIWVMLMKCLIFFFNLLGLMEYLVIWLSLLLVVFLK